MRSIFVLPVFLISNLIYSADTAQAQPSFFRFTRTDIGINFMPGTRYEASYFSENDFKISCSTGFLFRLVNKKLNGITTGIQFSNICRHGKAHPYFSVYLHPQSAPNGYNPLDSLITTQQSGYTFRFIDVPLLFNFTLVKKKTRVTVNAGLYLSYFINEKSTYRLELKNRETISTSSISKEDYYSRFQFAPVAGIGIEKDINDLFCLKVEPTVRYQAMQRSVFDDGRHFWEVGINFSLLKQL